MNRVTLRFRSPAIHHCKKLFPIMFILNEGIN